MNYQHASPLRVDVTFLREFPGAFSPSLGVQCCGVNCVPQKDLLNGTSLVAQWLRLCAPNAGGPGSIPGQELDPTCHN